MIRNLSSLIANGACEGERTARSHVLEALEAALEAAEPRALIFNKVKVADSKLTVGGKKLDLRGFRRVVVIGGGKASGGMAEAIESELGDYISAGIVNIPKQLERVYHTDRVKLHGAAHPLPSDEGVRGVEQMLEVVGEPSEKTLVICLISGGGSALMPFPTAGVSLSDKVAVSDLLLKSGTPIREINVVRKHLSGIKGGWLARKLHPCTILVFIISDVVDNLLDVIASGPAYPDPSTFKDSIAILKKYGLERKIPESVLKVLNNGVKGRLPETPKPGEACFERIHHFVIGSSKDACHGAYRKLRTLKCRPVLLDTPLEGEARNAGRHFANVVKQASARASRREPLSYVAGGETVVTVRGNGKGGRNQEAALSAATDIASTRAISIAFIGTDGLDGPTEAAGAIVDGHTVERAASIGLEAEGHLRRNDSFTFFQRLGDIVLTGPTGTNVSDVAVGVCC